MYQRPFNPLNHPEAFDVDTNVRAGGIPVLVPRQEVGLFDLVDRFAARRAEIENQALRQQREERIAAYTMRRLDAEEARNTAKEKFGRAKLNQEALASARKGNFGPTLMQDENGNPVTVTWEYVPGKGEVPVVQPAEQPSPETSQGPPPTMERAASDAFPRQQLKMPMLAGQPIAPKMRSQEPMQGMTVEQPEQPTVFIDENDEGNVRALTEPQDEGRAQLPIDAFPPGAKEGDRFLASDVNMRGGKGNPFAEPVPPIQMPRLAGQPLPAVQPQASVMQMPRTQTQGGVWRSKGMPGGEVTIDPREMEQSRRDEAMASVRDIDAALASDMVPENQKRQLAAIRPIVMSGMQPRFALELIRANETQANTSQKLEGQEGMLDKSLASKEKMAAERNKTQLTIAEMKRKRGPSGGSLVSGRAGDNGSHFQRLFAANPMKAERVANYVDNQIARTMKNVNFDKLQGQGINRLALGLKMLNEGGGTGEFEAMMNFFGYIRGGVPAKNETDEWHRMTRTGISVLNDIGRQLGFGMLGTIATSRDLTDEEKNNLKKKMTGLDPNRAKELRQAMAAARSELIKFAESTGEIIYKQFEKYRAPAEKELAQGKIDAIRHYAGLPEKDYFGLGRGDGGEVKQTGEKRSIREMLQDIEAQAGGQ